MILAHLDTKDSKALNAIHMQGSQKTLTFEAILILRKIYEAFIDNELDAAAEAYKAFIEDYAEYLFASDEELVEALEKEMQEEAKNDDEFDRLLKEAEETIEKLEKLKKITKGKDKK